MKRSALIIFSIWFAIIFLFAGSVSAKETITWPYFSFPPFVIMFEGEPMGISIDIQRYLQEGMPEYEHQRVLSPIVRSMLSAKNGEMYCFTGLLKTPEREKFLEYSRPCRVTPPLSIVTRKGALDEFKEPGGISLARLMNDDRFILGVIKEMSYGRTLDNLIQRNRNEKNVNTIFSTDTIDKLLSLILNQRIDYSIIVPMQAKYEAQRTGVADSIEFIPVLEDNEYLVGYIACTRNKTGREIIRKVNDILRDIIPTDDYFNLFAPWIDKSMLPDYKNNYKKLMLPPYDK